MYCYLFVLILSLIFIAVILFIKPSLLYQYETKSNYKNKFNPHKTKTGFITVRKEQEIANICDHSNKNMYPINSVSYSYKNGIINTPVDFYNLPF